MGRSFAHERRTSGRYGFQAVAGQVVADHRVHWAECNGLPFNMQYVYGSLRAADGTYWWPIRGAFEDQARRMHLSEAAPGTDFAWAPEGEAAYLGPVVHEERDGWMGVWRADGSHLMSTDGPRLRWTEDDFLDLDGELVGDAIQFYCPDDEEPLVYTTRWFRMSGTIKGTAVTGLVAHDSMHMRPGGNLITSPVITELQAAWVAFATELDDGSLQVGHLIWGTEGFDLMLIQRTDGPPIVARDLDVQVRMEEDFPVWVRYAGLRDTWIWEAHPAGYRDPIRSDLPEGHRRIQGWVHREGETRRPVCTEALMETYNGRLGDVIA